jgi:hypothetical protein
MKNEIFKISFAKYHSEKYKDSTNLDKRDLGLWGERDFSNKHPLFEREKSFTDENTFVENFGNPMYSVSRDYTMVVIEEKDDKVSFKIFWGGKYRKVGRPYFTRTKNVEFLTVNKKTGDVYVGFIHNYQKKKKFTQSIRRNYFLGKPVSSMFSKLKNALNNYLPNSSEVIFEISTKFFNSFCNESIELDGDQKLMKHYLDKRNFKYPNNFWVYSDFMWGKEYRKILKKNEFKVVDTFMQIWGVRGKKLKKFLHQTEKINISLYLSSRNLFGEDWMNQDGDTIQKILNSSWNLTVPNNLRDFATQEELKRIYSIFKSILNSEYINVWTFQDHMSTYVKLKQYGETDLKWLTDGSDIEKFQEEHFNWSEKLDHYRKGTYVRTYPTYFHDRIEQKIDNYYPVILTNSDDYNMESFTQQNCVKGYIGKVSSMIISLRKDDIDSKDRATIEYRITYLKALDDINVSRVQTLGKYNQRLDETWNDVLFKLDEVVVSCYKDKNFEPVKISKKCFNGVLLESDSHFDDDGNLRWTNKKNNAEIYYDEW